MNYTIIPSCGDISSKLNFISKVIYLFISNCDLELGRCSWALSFSLTLLIRVAKLQAVTEFVFRCKRLLDLCFPFQIR